ncbi:MAG: dephospho-CoA kinase [Methylococcales bacterium]
MLKIGLTGGIGCGKTIVANLFRRQGIEIIDADEIARRLTEPGEAGLPGVVQHFGTGILDSRRHLNRALLREIVFNSPPERKELEAILHPLVYQRIETEISRVRGGYCIVCVPLLLETGRVELFDRVLVIDSPVELQYERVRARDHLDDSQIARILENQAGREEKLSAADDVIFNDADLTSLDNQVEKLHNFYLKLSKNTGWLN